MSAPDAGMERSNACGRNPGMVGEKTGEIRTDVTDPDGCEGEDVRSSAVKKINVAPRECKGEKMRSDHADESQSREAAKEAPGTVFSGQPEMLYHWSDH